jgi:hypothetical protein
MRTNDRRSGFMRWRRGGKGAPTQKNLLQGPFTIFIEQESPASGNMSSNEQHHGSKPPRRRSGERAKPPRKVDHTYRDFSNYPTDDLPPLSLAPTNFPTKLHHILSDPDYHHVSQSFGSLRISSECQSLVSPYSHLLSFSTTSTCFRSSHGW